MTLKNCTIKLTCNEAVYIGILFMTFYTAPLFSYCPVRFSDIGGLILFYIGFKEKKNIPASYFNIFFIAFGLWALIETFIVPLIFYDFSFKNHITQLIRLELSILVYLYTFNLINAIGRNNIIDILKKVIITHAVVQIIYVILYYCNIRFIFNIIDNFDKRLSLIANNNLFFNHFVILNTESGGPRFSGLFEEPAWYGWTICILIAIVLQNDIFINNNNKNYCFKIKEWIIIIVSFIFTFSLSAIAALGVICTSYIMIKNKKHFFKALLFIILICCVLLIYVFINPNILARILLISEGGDGSTSSRFIGSWNALVTLLNTFPITGYGLGDLNSQLFFSYAFDNALEKGIKIGNIHLMEIHNLISQVICNLGIIGGILLLYSYFKLIKFKTLIIGIGFILVFFTVNVYNTFLFMAISGLAFNLFSNKRYNITKEL